MPSPKDKEIKDPFAGMTSKEVHLDPKKVTTTNIEDDLLSEAGEGEDGFKVAPFKGMGETEPKVDLKDLDESTLLKYPIEAKMLNDAPMLQVKPVDSGLIFRWVYCGALKTDRQGSINVFKYKKMGFEFASVEDIQGGNDMLVDGMLEDGGKIHNFDTVLMKFSKIRLMGHYKANLLRSYDKVNNALKQAKSAAQTDIAGTAAYRNAMSTHPNAEVEFYSPTDTK